ncbi:sulfurtransferase [Aquimarina muelleri]|uniref:Sulfurtransferase n=1 Tax=Aquimarina muelleri TaxID=279356 RepID=A0A918JYY3_9FLAO|nr:sulfurtransferase [Aquimarina muelleri]MCX2763773.1 sulfurtransferase [Aquimarina muelleri]GGX29581.1 sulfurtransferase [Aquimarina muelleri]
MKTLKIANPVVSIDWLAEHLDHPDLIILDASIKKVTSKENLQKLDLKIKGARFFDLKNSFSDKNTNIPNMLPSPDDFSEECRKLGISSHHKIIIYDTLGIYSSPRAWWMFKAMGHQNVAVLNGGLPAWHNAKLPCEPENKTEYNYGNFKANYTPSLVTTANTVLIEIDNENSLTIDARSHGRFIAKEPEPRKSLKGGHIPNSVNLPYTMVLDKNKMKTHTELQEVFKNYNIDNKELIFTCGSGITACIIMLAAEIAEYHKISVYDGSWSEWGQLDRVPIQC